MKIRTSTSMIAACVLVLLVPLSAGAKDKKKKDSQRGMLESMQSVPCGVKQGGLNGLGSVFGSVGIEHVNSNEKLCTQYLLRTDEMEYHIRPEDTKHAALLPVGKEGEFKIKKDRLFLRVPDSDKKARAYYVISMQPLGSEDRVESYNSVPHTEKPADSRLIDKPNGTAEQIANRPPR